MYRAGILNFMSLSQPNHPTSFSISNLTKSRTTITPDDVRTTTQMMLTVNDEADTQILLNLRPDGFCSWEEVSFDE